MVKNKKVAVVGLGYIGLPVAVSFSKEYKVVGYDISENRINELKSNIDKTNEIQHEDLKNCNMKTTL